MKEDVPGMNRKTASLLEIHLAVLLFGFTGLFGKFLSVAPLVIVWGRTFFASLILYLVLRFFSDSRPFSSGFERGMLALMGAILALHWIAFFHSIQLSTVAIGLLTFATFPVFITFMEPYFFNEKMQGMGIATTIFVMAGALLMVPAFDFSNQHTKGAFWGIVSGFLFAVLSLLNRNYVKRYPPLMIAFYQNLFAMLFLLPFAVFSDWNLQSRDFLLLAVLGVFCTASSHVLFIRGLIHIKAQLASIFTCLEPVYGVVLAYMLLGEVPTWKTLSGGAIILLTTTFASWRAYLQSMDRN